MVLVIASLLIGIPSRQSPIGWMIFTQDHIFCSSLLVVSSSSLRVPGDSSAVDSREDTFSGRILREMQLHVTGALNSSLITSSHLEPVSSAPSRDISRAFTAPSLPLRAAPKKRFGRCGALASTPPVGIDTLPDAGTTVL